MGDRRVGERRVGERREKEKGVIKIKIGDAILILMAVLILVASVFVSIVLLIKNREYKNKIRIYEDGEMLYTHYQEEYPDYIENPQEYLE